MRQRLLIPGVARALKPTNIDSPGDLIARYYLFNENALRPLSADATINTDSHPILEYSAHNLLKEPVPGAYQMANVKLLQEFTDRPTLPLQQLGDSRREKVTALMQLASDYEEHGRFGIAKQFRKMAVKM